MAPTPARLALATASLAVLAAAAAALASSASAGITGTRTCHGLPVTVRASEGTVVGTSGRDVIALTGPATVYAGRGDDLVCGSGAGDTVYAGPGDDVVLGRRGADRVMGGPGRDRLYGEQGADTLDGGPGADVLMGGSGRNRVRTNGSRSANEASAPSGDTVVPGTDAISFVASARSWPDLSAMGLQAQWVQTVSGSSPVVGQLTQPSYSGPGDTPLSASIAFPPLVGAYYAPFPDVPMEQWMQPGQAVQAQGQVAFAVGQQASHADEIANALSAQSQGPWPSLMSATPAIGGSWVSGFTQDTRVDGHDLGQLPVSAQWASGLAVQSQQPTRVWIFLAATGVGYGPWTIAGPSPGWAGAQVDFSGPSEVVGVAYDNQRGWTQD